MKNAYLIIFILLIGFSGCDGDDESTQKNLAEIELEIQQLTDDYLEAWNNKDVDKLDQITADNGEYYGSDPDEIMDKTALLDMYSGFFEDTTSSYIYTVDMREIRVSYDGNSALVMERITFPEWSPEMPMCQTSHIISIAGDWKIDFICWGFIMENEDVPGVNDIL